MRAVDDIEDEIFDVELLVLVAVPVIFLFVSFLFSRVLYSRIVASTIPPHQVRVDNVVHSSASEPESNHQHTE